MNSVSILGIPLFSGNISNAISIVLYEIKKQQSKKSRLITATNAHGLVISQKNKELEDILNKSFLNLPDGMSSVWLGRLKGKSEMNRCYGPDLFVEIIKKTSEQKINHFFCGGKDGVGENLKEFCQRELNNTNIVGTHTPPFTEMTDEEINLLIQQVNNAKTDILWLGLSCPKQEFLANRLKNLVNVHFIITVGAAFDFHTRNLKQAPQWIQHSGLEWLFRLLIEPKRLWKRYFTVVPLFIFYNLNEFIKSRFLLKNKTNLPIS